MKILYLSLPCFFDSDAPIIADISKYSIITYCLVVQANNHLDIDFVKAYCRRHNVDLKIFEAKYRQKDPRSILQYLSFIFDLRKEKYDISYIYCNDNPVISLFSIFFTRKSTIVFIHDVKFHSSYAHTRYLKIGRWINLLRFYHFQVFSESQLTEFKNRYSFKKVHAIPLTLKNFGPPSNAPVFPNHNNKCVFLFFGKILPYKGLKLLIEAMNILCKKFSDVHLIIAGKCENWEEYDRLIDQNDNFSTFINYVPDDMIPDLFASAKFLVLPYFDATQSGPLMIAYNYNLPVIASDVPSFCEFMKDGTTGFLFKQKNLEHLVKTLEHVRSLNIEEYNCLKHRMKVYTHENYSIDSVAPKYRQMFFSTFYF